MQAATNPLPNLSESTPEDWLNQLTNLFLSHKSMTALLQKASELSVELLDVEQCVITWLTEDQAALEVRASYRHNGKNGMFVNTFKSDRTAAEAEYKNAAVPTQNDGSISWRRPTKDKLATPLYIREEVIGYLCVSKRRKGIGMRFSSIDAKHFFLLGQYIGFAIEMQQMRQLLASRYAAVALSRSMPEESSEQDGLFTRIVDSVKFPNKMAKIIAKSFYKDLRKAGFEPKQILVVASEIIENLNEAFRKTKAKTDELNG